MDTFFVIEPIEGQSSLEWMFDCDIFIHIINGVTDEIPSWWYSGIPYGRPSLCCQVSLDQEQIAAVLAESSEHVQGQVAVWAAQLTAGVHQS